MSAIDHPELRVPEVIGVKVGIVASQWHNAIVDELVDRAVKVAAEAKAEVSIARVPGAIEIPIVAQQLAKTCDAVVALGVVVKGGTPHFEYVSQSVTSGLTRVALDTSTPIGNGVLTVNNLDQAKERSGGKSSIEDKGGEAMAAALQTFAVLQQLRAEAGDDI